MIRPVPSQLAYFSAHFGAAPADDYLTKVTLDTAKEARNASGQSWFPGKMPGWVLPAAAVAGAAGLALILFPNLLGGAPQSAPNRYDR